MFSVYVQKFIILLTPVRRNGRIPPFTNLKESLDFSARTTSICFIKEEKFTTPRIEKVSRRNPVADMFYGSFVFSPTDTCFPQLSSAFGINKTKANAIYREIAGCNDVIHSSSALLPVFPFSEKD